MVAAEPAVAQESRALLRTRLGCAEIRARELLPRVSVSPAEQWDRVQHRPQAGRVEEPNPRENWLAKWGRTRGPGTSFPKILRGTPPPRGRRECPEGRDSVSQSAPRHRAPTGPGRCAGWRASPGRFPRGDGGAMDSPEVTFTLAYLVFAVCFVFTPTEFHSAGLTVQNLLSGWLGSEDAAFVPYHLRRTAATLLCHSLLPLGYYVGMCFAASEKQLYYPSQTPETWRAFLLLALMLPAIACTLIYYWSRDRWARHPLARTLALYALPRSGWRAVASSVNTEFRRIDKFATGVPGARVIVTDTWVMKVTTYRVHVAQQQDVHLTVTESQQHDLSPDSNLPVQLLTIRVASANPAVQAFDIRLNSTEYGELCEKLRAPIRSAANVVIHQSLGDLFLETFASLVEVNPAYSVPSSQDLEACIGCMQTRASVKLVKTCQAAAEGECQQCYCRPMWCLTCMGKWFASRQDPQRPDTWLASRVPCPTCRARFCILDVCAVR
ncbi:E3 ubiquitin-protein ligase TM129 [Cervus canadensis]|uniref:E3 ubiquitin-protein ligase TM129 n=1 Tax=Cervus canadensis TaxID=1574408 RepID=UPI0018B8AF46|nr:E3 ubiquitin-protein ligase TM129 [Cervus canadensis]